MKKLLFVLIPILIIIVGGVVILLKVRSSPKEEVLEKPTKEIE